MRKIALLVLFGAAACDAAVSVTTQAAEVLTSPRSASSPTRMIFPFVFNQSGFDTEVRIENTSQDTQGSTPRSGVCTLTFFQNGGALPAQTTTSIAPGTELSFNVSTGGSGVAAEPGFLGYVAASCAFPLARGSQRIFVPGTGNLAFVQDAQLITTPRSTATPQNFLFPFVTDLNGLDTGMIINNASLDPFGTTPVAGSCQLQFFDGTTSGPHFSANTGTINPGVTYLNLASQLAPNFQGYVIATCNFPGAALWAFVSDSGSRNLGFNESAELLPPMRDPTPHGLLFPLVYDTGGNDTTIAIANTSADTVRSTPTPGSCTLYTFGTNAAAPFSTGLISAGSVYSTHLSAFAPNYRGQVIAVCDFPGSRGYAMLAPTAGTDGDSETAEIISLPRNISTPSSLLFASTTTRDNRDTTINIRNTSLDVFGTPSSAGTCTISYFGDVAGGGQLPAPQTSTVIQPGAELFFSLTSGNVSQGIQPTPGFRGYIIADCGFPLARGMATTFDRPDLAIRLTHGAPFVMGDTADVFNISVGNASAPPTFGTVTVTTTLAPGLTPVSIAGTGWSCVLGTLTCTRTDALLGGGVYPNITLTVAVGIAPYTATATVSGGGETNFLNDTATDDGGAAGNNGPILSITSTHTGNFPAGGSGTYTITITNTGNTATSGTVTMTDPLPLGEFTNSITSAPGWNCVNTNSPAQFTVVCTRSDSLAPGASYPNIVLKVNTGGSAPALVFHTPMVTGGGFFFTSTFSEPTNIVGGTLFITVGTNPAGLSFTVDGVTYTNTLHTSWARGSQHTISTTTPQFGPNRQILNFLNWSDGGAISHTVTVITDPTSNVENFFANFGTPR